MFVLRRQKTFDIFSRKIFFTINKVSSTRKQKLQEGKQRVTGDRAEETVGECRLPGNMVKRTRAAAANDAAMRRGHGIVYNLLVP